MQSFKKVLIRKYSLILIGLLIPKWSSVFAAKNCFPAIFNFSAKIGENVLKCFVHVLKLLDCNVDWKVECVDGESLDGPEAVIETYKNK